MSTFDSFPDTSYLLKREGEMINIVFKPNTPNKGQATIEWTIPEPAQGCDTDDERGEYAGIVIVLDNKPIEVTKKDPVNPENFVPLIESGKQYTADPTANKDMHAGDKIGDAIVVGAVYEREEKHRGEFTNSIVINDVDSNTPYYVAGFATDAQFRYHIGGIRAYSDQFGLKNIVNETSAKQFVRFQRDQSNNSFVQAHHDIHGRHGVHPSGSGAAGFGGIHGGLHGSTSDYGPAGHSSVQRFGGVLPTDGTGLTPGKIYQFDIEIDPTFPRGIDKRTVLVSVSGEKVGTYQELIDEINKQLAQADNPIKSPERLNKGRYYWDQSEQTLYQWNGDEHIKQDAFVEPSDPSTVAQGTYWYDTDNEILKQYDGTQWDTVSLIKYSTDPTNLTSRTDYWFDGVNARRWEPNAWCSVNTFIQTNDPSMRKDVPVGAYWFDTSDEQLLRRDTQTEKWEQVFAIMWDVDPQNLSDQTYWFNDTDKQLNVFDSNNSTFENVKDTYPVLIQKTKPSNPVDQAFWYDTKNERLFQFDANIGSFTELDVLVWPDDPTDRDSCDLWWDTSTDTLNIWDSVNNQWNQVPSFSISDTDPYGPEDLEVYDVWINQDQQMYFWDGSEWVETTFIDFPTDPANPSDGVVWHNTESNTWQVWNSSQWNSIDPIESINDPTNIPQNTLWFDTSTESLSERIGSQWVSIPFTTTKLTPSKGQQYFDLVENKLKQWNDGWEDATPLATVELDDNGFIKFETTFTGSSACIMILVPHDSEAGLTSDFRMATGKVDYNDSDQNDWWLAGSIHHHFFSHHGPFNGTATSRTDVTKDEFIFDHLEPPSRIQPQVYGNHGVSSEPSYQEIGIGDDGSTDERRTLMDTVRSQLGYPVVEIELTTFQIDEAVRRAIDNFRKRSSSGYKRGFYFLDIVPGQQRYRLTDRKSNFHKIVTVTSAHRFTSAFLSTAHGAGAYGQVVMQHLYNMGTYDLTSFHMVSQYIEQLEHLFATRLVFNWDEQRRLLSFYHSFVYPETVLLDCSVERSEQELITDRWTKNWIERWATMEARMTLSEIRGKYASLPGAGGGVALNASDLQSKAENERQELLAELEDFESDTIEDWGMHSTFIIG